MMSATFDEVKLQPSFTFHVIEAIKRTKIQSPPSKATLPFGISLAAGLVVLMLSFTLPQSPVYPVGQWIGSVLPSKTQVPEVGVIPVNIIEIADVSFILGGATSGGFPPLSTSVSSKKKLITTWGALKAAP